MIQSVHSGFGWYLLYSKPRQEEEALARLSAQGYEVYLPRVFTEVQRRGRKIKRLVPLFPRYLFIRLEGGMEGRSWAPVRSTRGVSHFVRFGARLAPVNVSIIEVLRQLEADQSQCPAPLYQTAERLRIVEGPYAGLSAVFRMDDGESRATVLIELLNKIVTLTLPLAALVKDQG